MSASSSSVDVATATGTGLPQFTISGFASPVASWGGPLTVTANLSNIGTPVGGNPLALAPGSAGTADAAVATTIGVFASTNPHFKNALEVGTVAAPALATGAVERLTQTITLPTQPAGFPGDGGRIYIALVADATNQVYEATAGNSVSRPVKVQIEAPLPELRAVGLDLPATLQPGDTVQPNIRITNIGPADTAPQGPVQVALVASTTRSFTSGSSIVGLFTVANVPSASEIATSGTLLGDANQTPPANVVTIAGSVVTLPVSPKTYFLGVVIDPNNLLKQLSGIAKGAKPLNRFTLIRTVGPPINHLPPAGVLTNGGATLVPTFPTPLNGQPVGTVPGSTFPITPSSSPPSPPAGGV